MEHQQGISGHYVSQSGTAESPNEKAIQMSCLQQPEASPYGEVHPYGASQLPAELVLVKTEPVMPIQASLQPESLYDNWSMVPSLSTSLQLQCASVTKGELLLFASDLKCLDKAI